MVVKRRWAAWLALGLLACSGRETNVPHPTSGGASGATSSLGGTGGAERGGGPQGGATNVGPDTALKDFPRVYASALCSAFEQCWTAFIDATNGREGCIDMLERVGQDRLFAHLESAVAEGRVTYHPEVLPGCLQSLESGACEGYVDEPCAGLFLGTKQAGDSCELDSECAGNSQCLVQDSCPGRCGPRPALGEPCTPENACDMALACATQADGSGICVQPAGLGDGCGAMRPCAGLLFCDGRDSSSLEATGTCIERGLVHDGEEGAACDGLGAERLCQPGLVCSFLLEGGETVGRCQPKAAAGGPCTYSIPDPCPLTEYCQIDTSPGVKPATGACAPRPKLGESCRYGTIHVAPCGDGIAAVCHPETERCVTVKRLGENCTSDQECVGGACDETGRCAALLECEEAAEEAP